MDNTKSKNALTIGAVCIVTYLVNYYSRYILSVLTPRLLETQAFTVEHIGALSSVYMFFYAAGQLSNGFLGDSLSPRKMAPVGIAVSGTLLIVFPFIKNEILQILLFAAFGFSLSMVRGPFMKIISENTKPNQARLICIFFSFSSFAGPLIASLLAIINDWHWVFIVSGLIAAAVAVASYIILSSMERNGKISYRISKKRGFSFFSDILKIERFGFYMAVAALVEISGTAVTFWIPTFLTDKLLFSETAANSIFSAISLARAIMPFVTLAIFRATKEKDLTIMRVSFAVSSILFGLMLIQQNRFVSLFLMLFSLLSLSCPSALLWSIYIPNLGKTGRVSSVNGVLDCTGYIAASAANMIFAKAMNAIGWNTVIILLSGIGVMGIAFTFLCHSKKTNNIFTESELQ